MPDFSGLPDSAVEFSAWPWERVAPYANDLLTRPITAESINAWLADWSRLAALLQESLARLSVAASVNTADAQIQERLQAYFSTVAQPGWDLQARLNQRWLQSGLSAPGYERVLDRLKRQEQKLPANRALEARVEELAGQYWGIIGAQTISWESHETHLGYGGSDAILHDLASREQAERLWRLAAARALADRDALHALWRELFDLRVQIAANAGYASFLDFQWKAMGRADYTPADCRRFHAAVRTVAVPLALRHNEHLCEQMGLESLRPWDATRALPGQPPIPPFASMAAMEEATQWILAQIHPQFGRHFAELRAGGVLDLEARPNKTPGGFSRGFGVSRLSFISLQGSGAADEIFGLIHEAGHALSTMESRHLSFLQLTGGADAGGGELTELTSQAMEQLAMPFLGASAGGPFSDEHARRLEREHLAGTPGMLAYVAVVDAFQHWAYSHPAEGRDPLRCEEKWLELEETYIPGMDWSGLELERKSSWLTQGMLFTQPLFFIEYAISLLGALQIRRNAVRDPSGAAEAFRRCLAMAGHNASLAERYAAAGARFAFDQPALEDILAWFEQRLAELQ